MDGGVLQFDAGGDVPLDAGPGLQLVKRGPVSGKLGVSSAGQKWKMEPGGNKNQQREIWRLPGMKKRVKLIQTCQ